MFSNPYISNVYSPRVSVICKLHYMVVISCMTPVSPLPGYLNTQLHPWEFTTYVLWDLCFLCNFFFFVRGLLPTLACVCLNCQFLTANPSGEYQFTARFRGFVLLNLSFSVQCFVDHCLSFFPFYFDHCTSCPSLIYSF